MTKEFFKNHVIESLVHKGVIKEFAIDQMTPMTHSLQPPHRPSQHDTMPEGETETVNPLEFERTKWEFQIKLQQMQLEAKIREQEIQLKMKDLEVKEKEISLTSDFKNKEVALKEKLATFNPAKATTLVPAFDESDVDGSFKTFENIAKKNQWPEDRWLSVLVPKLCGKASRVYNSLECTDDYNDVKKTILYASAITPDGYREVPQTNLTICPNFCGICPRENRVF